MKNLFLIAALAFLWAVGGFTVGIALQALFGVAWVMPCTALNLMAGMLMLLLITRNEYARRMFYEGPRQNEAGLLFIGLLWGLPLILIFLGIVWWLMAQLLP